MNTWENPIDPNRTIGRLLFDAPKCGLILENLGISPTRDAGQTLTAVCRRQGLHPQTVARTLAAGREAIKHLSVACVELMTLPELCNHLDDAQGNIRQELKHLDRLTTRLTDEHAANQSDLMLIRKSVTVVKRLVEAHLRRESRDLFSVFRQPSVLNSPRGRGQSVSKEALARFEQEHSHMEEALADLGHAVGECSPSSSTREMLQAISRTVSRLDQAIHEHIYKENRVLFPRALGSLGLNRNGRQPASEQPSGFTSSRRGTGESAQKHKTTPP